MSGLDMLTLLGTQFLSRIENRAGTFAANTISERTSGSGVTACGVLFDGGSIDGVSMAAYAALVGSFVAALASLTTAEITQLAAIDSATIDAATWARMGALDQSVATTASPSVSTLTATTAAASDTISERTGAAGVTVEGVLFKDGLVNGVDLSALAAELASLTTAEVTQLAAIGATTISTAQWGYLRDSVQALTTASSPTFAALDVSSAVATDALGEYTGSAGVTVESVLVQSSEVDGVAVASLPDFSVVATDNPITQAAKIDATTIGATAWGHLGGLGGDVSTTANPAQLGTLRFSVPAVRIGTATTTANSGVYSYAKWTTSTIIARNISLGAQAVSNDAFVIGTGQDGLYHISVIANQTTSGANPSVRAILVYVNGSLVNYLLHTIDTGSTTSSLCTEFFYPLVATNKVNVRYYQTSGSAATILGRFSMIKVG